MSLFFSGVTYCIFLYIIVPHSRLGGWEDLLDELSRTLLQLTAYQILIGGCDQARCALIRNISRSEVRRQLTASIASMVATPMSFRAIIIWI